MEKIRIFRCPLSSCLFSVFLFLLVLFPSIASKPEGRWNADLEFFSYSGGEEHYQDTGTAYLRTRGNESYKRSRLYFDGELHKKLGSFRFQIFETFDGDLYSIKDLDNRDSYWNNDLKVQGDIFLADKFLLRAWGKMSFFEDKSFVEYSSENLEGVLEFEKNLRRNVFLTAGYEADDLNYRFSSVDDYWEQSVYMRFSRYSPPVYTLKKKALPPKKRNGIPADLISEDAKKQMDQNHLRHVLSLIDEKDEIKEMEEWISVQTNSGFLFQMEGRLRKRELFNILERSFIEGQLAAQAQFVISKTHLFVIKNDWYDRDYAKQSLADNILSYQRNLTQLSHSYSSGKFLLNHGISYDSYFYKNQIQNDFSSFNFDSRISWDVMKNWNLYWYNTLEKFQYKTPREFYTNHEGNYGSFTVSWNFLPRWTFKTIFDRETKNYKWYENVIDSSFQRKAEDFRLTLQSSGNLSWNIGYKWERERHDVYSVNDRYEDLFYVSSRFTH